MSGNGHTSEPGQPARIEPADPSPRRGFWSLIATQFQGAFSDNALKWLVIFLITGLGFSNEKRDRLVACVGALFPLPFILFSMSGGYLADRYSKRSVTIGVKLFEIVVMSIALAGLAAGQLYLAIGCVFLMGVHSAIFGPSKYGLLPELLPEQKLSWGNGVLELGTFLSIIAGTVAGGWLCTTFAGRQAWSGVLLIALAIGGLVASLGIDRVPPANPAKRFQANFLGDLWQQIGVIRKDRVLWLATLGNTYFFAVGALVQFLIVIYAKDVLGIDDPQKSSFLQAATAIGIGAGSFAAGYLSGNKIEYGLVPFGAVGMTALTALLARHGLSFGTVALDLAFMGFFGGFFIVPIAALLQHRPDPRNKGGVLAAANLLSFVGVFLGSGAYFLFTVQLRLSPPTVFLVTAVATLAATIYVLFLLPDALLRFVLWGLTRTIYRIRVLGRDHIPAKGGALFVCNHVSFVDALLLLASTDRQVRFMMFTATYERPFLKPFARILGVIPISSEQRPRAMIKSLQTAADAIRAGEVVCIFAEGQITRLGHLLPFRRGFERIMKDSDAPIIPVALDGVWGSIFSFDRGRFLWKFPRRRRYPVTVNYGKPLPSNTAPFEVRQAVQELLAEAWQERRARQLPLHRAWLRMARRHPFRFAMADAGNARLSFASVLVRTVVIARRLRPAWAEQQRVGILLPPSVPGALVNLAALLSGKVPVNLNYTVSEDTLASCIRQCDIRTVVTSQAFLDKIKLQVPCKVVRLDQVMGMARSPGTSRDSGMPVDAEPAAAPPGMGEKIAALMMAWLLPVSWLQRALRSPTPTIQNSKLKTQNSEITTQNSSTAALATVIFSSGSTGDPKGVMLSHYNIVSNIEQLEQVFGLSRRDCFLGVLPFFHSFGFTGTLCLPAVLGTGVVYYPNPLDAKAIGPLVRTGKVTFLLATPTFLQLYMRGCSAEDFGGLRAVVTAAEKLPERVATAFEEQFGIRPLEAYGCTECAPAVAVNTLDFRSAGFRQIGTKRGTIGHPVPGVSVRIVDPQSLLPLPTGQPGLLLVRGPNVMQGYLGKPEKTAEVLQDGWYSTGDVATIDEDGFLQITDRLSRFSKIGGEMVPHIRIEEKLHELAQSNEQTFVVAGMPDDKKGERLLVLHRLDQARLQSCVRLLSESDLPNLWKPRPDQFFRVESFPYLGTGKLDLRKIREMAAQLVVGHQSVVSNVYDL